jgi:pimeloyl-ACP methyl ester carboxylesterase
MRIAYERRGSGPPLVLLHGGMSDHREWRRQLEGLSDAFTVVAWDAPGNGGSSDPPESFRFDEYAGCLAGFVEALGLGRPHVLGLSWGSSLALALYGRRPDVPRSLILAAAYAGWTGSLQRDEVKRRLADALREMDLPAEQYARSWIPTLLTERARPEVAEELVSIMRDFRPGGARPMLQAMAEADLRPVLPTIRVPTLLLSGEDDARSPTAVAREMQRAIPGSELVILPRVGHQSNIEAADRFNDEVRRFLGAVS